MYSSAAPMTASGSAFVNAAYAFNLFTVSELMAIIAECVTVFFTTSSAAMLSPL
jgi:hypothetical protein